LVRKRVYGKFNIIMAITEPHYHFSTGKSSKNRGKFYRCRGKPTTDILKACCMYPAYRDAQGKDRIDDTRHELVLMGLLSDDDGLTLEEEKEALDSPCILGPAFSNDKNKKKEAEAALVVTTELQQEQ
jgi:hypothetical protein